MRQLRITVSPDPEVSRNCYLDGFHFGRPLLGLLQGFAQGKDVGQIRRDVPGLEHDAFQGHHAVRRPGVVISHVQ